MAILSEINGLSKDVDHSIGKLDAWAADEVIDTPITLAPGKTKLVYEPLGVAVIIGPWNFPYYCTIGPLIAAIGAGNCAVIKPSEGSPTTMYVMKKLVDQFLDTSCYECVTGGVNVGRALT